MKDKTNTWYRKKLVMKAKEKARERDKNKCVWCGNDGRTKQLHGSHVFPEGRYPSLSADVENIKMLCAYCHLRRWHESPVEAMEWFKKKYPERYKRLKEKSLKIIKVDWKTLYENS